LLTPDEFRYPCLSLREAEAKGMWLFEHIFQDRFVWPEGSLHILEAYWLLKRRMVVRA
jgi:hypothetical protein